VDLHASEPGLNEGRLLYLAEHLAAFHASHDQARLAGRFEFLGEKALGAALSVLALPDERGAFRPVSSASPRTAATRDVWAALDVDSLPANSAAADAFGVAEQCGRPIALRVNDLFPDAAIPPGCDAAIVAPLQLDGEFLGVGMFVVAHTPMAETIAAILANHTAVALSQLRDREDARRLHSVDPVLWVPDEHFLLAQFRREVNRARRYGRDVGLAILRLENEAEVRRRFGDFFAGHLLRRIGSQLLASVRDSDVLGALDGAYAVIHTETSLAGTQLSAERLRDAVVDMVRRRFPEAPAPEISVCAVSYPETAAGVEALLDALLEPAGHAAAAA